MFTVTKAAAQQIQHASITSDAQALALRIAAKRNQDGSMEYGMGFDEAKDEDMRVDLNGVSVVIAEEHQALLDATVLDFVELNPGEFNFIFTENVEPASCASSAKSTGSSGCGSGGCSGGGCGSSKMMH